MTDYTLEGMLKRIETLEKVIDLQQETLNKLISYIERHKPEFINIKTILDMHNDRIGNLEHPDN